MIDVVAFDTNGTLTDTQAVPGKLTAWLRRDPRAQFGRWSVEPHMTLASLDVLASRLREKNL